MLGHDGADRGALRAEYPAGLRLRASAGSGDAELDDDDDPLILTHHAVRPQRRRTAPHGPGHLPGPRHPHGWRARAVRHRRRHERRPDRRHPGQSARRARTTPSRSASTRSRSARRPTRRTGGLGAARRRCASSTRERRELRPDTSAFTAKGKALLLRSRPRGSATSRSNRKKPDPTVANLMVQAYGARGLRNYAEAVKAMEFVIDATPNRATAVRAARPARLRRPSRRARATCRPRRRSRSRRRTSARTAQTRSTAPDSRGGRAGATSGQQRRPPPAGPGRAPASRYLLSSSAPVAQLAEQRTLNPKVPGSIPGGGTRESPAPAGLQTQRPPPDDRVGPRPITLLPQCRSMMRRVPGLECFDGQWSPPTASIRSYMLRMPFCRKRSSVATKPTPSSRTSKGSAVDDYVGRLGQTPTDSSVAHGSGELGDRAIVAPCSEDPCCRRRRADRGRRAERGRERAPLRRCASPRLKIVTRATRRAKQADDRSSAGVAPRTGIPVAEQHLDGGVAASRQGVRTVADEPLVRSAAPSV